MIFVFSLLGAIGSIFLAAPQARRSYKVSTKGISLSTYYGFFSVALVWIPHGIFHDVPMLSMSNAISSIFCFIVIYSIARDQKKPKYIAIGIALALFFLITYIFAHLIIRVMITTGLSILLRLPQLLKSFFSKDIAGISINTWLISGSCNAAWFLVGLLNKDIGMVIPTAFNVISSFTIVIVVSLRSRKASKVDLSNEI